MQSVDDRKQKTPAARVKITKADPVRKMVSAVFYASADASGAPVVDHSGETVDQYEIERAFQDGMARGIIGGEMHMRGPDGVKVAVGKIVECFTITDEKATAFGLGTRLRGAIGTIHVPDEDAFAKVVSGEYAMVSIGGKARRRQLVKAETFTPPKAVRDAARRALEVRESKPPSQRGMTRTGLARANQLANGEPVSVETLRRMASFFARHEESSKGGSTWDDQGKGWQAWHGWGGDAGKRWAESKLKQIDGAD